MTRLDKRHNGIYYIIERKGKTGKLQYLKSLGRIPKEEAERELALWKRQLDIKPIYRTIVVDPPWPIEKIKREVRPNQIDMDYKTMTVDEIKDFPVKKFVDPRGCHIYLWTTQRFLPQSFDVLKEWGFTYIFTMVWHKPGGYQPVGLPQYNCEFALFGKNNTLSFTDLKDFPVCFNAPRKEHSRKPDEFYTVVKRVSPEPRIDLFSREKRTGFGQWGDEIDKF